jgi:carbon-monoxide dehydrogenase large subunit
MAKPEAAVGGREIGKERLLRGQGTYVGDIRVAGTLEMVVVRSPHAHARIARIDAASVLADARVRALWTAADLREMLPRALATEPPSLASGEVRFVGQPVAVLAVEADRYVAEDLAEAVRVDYEALPATVEADRPLHAPRVRPDRDSDDAFADTVEYGDVDAAFAQAPVVVSFSQRLGRATGHPLEPRAILCVPEPLGALTVYSAHQSAHGLRRELCAVLGLGEERVRVVLPDVGGGFGIKNGLYPEDPLCALLALRTGRPVRFLEDRREHFAMGNPERESVQRVRVAATRDGRLLAVDGVVVADHGAYDFKFPIVAHVAINAPATYRVPAFRVAMRSVFTNKTPQGPYRGAGRPQGNYLMERAMDRLADALGLDRVEVRRRNLRSADEYPVTLPAVSRRGPRPIHLDSADLPALLDAALASADLAVLRTEQQRSRDAGVPYGIGVALTLEDTGTPPFEGARAYLTVDGLVHVVAGTPSQGQGHETVFTRLAADALGVDPDRIRVDPLDTAVLARGVGTFGSRTATSGAVAVRRAAEGLRQRLTAAAAALFEAASADVEIAGDAVFVRGVPARRLTLAALAQRVLAPAPAGRDATPELSETVYVPVRQAAWSAGVHVVALTVDPDDYRVRVRLYLIASDCGRRLDPAIVDGQLIGGVSHGLSGALFEEILYDEGGQLLTQSFMDYLLPTAAEMPRVRLVHRETPTPLTPLGAKGVGESGTIPAAAAIASAVEDALGIEIDRLPITPARLFAAVRARRDGEA